MSLSLRFSESAQFPATALIKVYENRSVFPFRQVVAHAPFSFFTNDIDGKSLPYYVFRPLVLDCLEEETEFHLNKRDIKRIVLDRSKVGSHKVFQIGGVMSRYLIVDLEILELALYGGIRPFLFTPVLLSAREEV